MEFVCLLIKELLKSLHLQLKQCPQQINKSPKEKGVCTPLDRSASPYVNRKSRVCYVHTIPHRNLSSKVFHTAKFPINL